MKTKIPAQTIIKCDVCQKECDIYNRKQSGELIINQDALDFQGNACANGNTNFDLCDNCLNRIIKALNYEIETIRMSVNEKESV